MRTRVSISPCSPGLSVEGEGHRDIYKETQVPGSGVWWLMPLLAEMGDMAGGRGIAVSEGDPRRVYDACGTASRSCLLSGLGGPKPRRDGCAGGHQHIC